MIHKVQLKNGLWAISFKCKRCGSIERLNVRPAFANHVVRKIMDGKYPCGKCKESDS